MQPAKHDLRIEQGSTLRDSLRLMQPRYGLTGGWYLAKRWRQTATTALLRPVQAGRRTSVRLILPASISSLARLLLPARPGRSSTCTGTAKPVRLPDRPWKLFKPRPAAVYVDHGQRRDLVDRNSHWRPVCRVHAPLGPRDEPIPRRHAHDQRSRLAVPPAGAFFCLDSSEVLAGSGAVQLMSAVAKRRVGR
ncbi:hypothetical protein FEV13_03500 [Stutzerimonas degradans]|nr:hypothetical protein FEV13_03500 [Stutzerimonas degradans]